MPDVLVLAALPALLGFAIGRWWLLLIGALVTTTSVGQLAGHGADAGPVATVLVAPFVGCALGVAARRARWPPRDPA
jgi:hypothetical protein